jgi:prolipoprotein diacylglyceryltransferase
MKHLEETPWWICDTDDENYCAYVDTDSNYFNAEPLLLKLYPNFEELPDKEKDSILEKIALKYQDVINEDYDRLAREAFNVTEHRLEMNQLARHPSQLYEVALEGIVLFTFLWWFSSKHRPRMAVTGLFALGYGSFRFFIEFFREPDLHLGFVALDWMTMGQVLSAPLIVAGVILLVLAYMKPQP